MSKTPPTELMTCPECGASGVPAGGRCWLCHAQLGGEVEIVVAEVVSGPPKFAVGEVVSAVACIAILAVLALMGIGMVTEDPGMLVPFLIVVVPALTATLVRGVSRRQEGRPLRWSERLATLVISGSITVGVLGLIGVALLAALFVVCVVSMSNMNM